MKTGFVLYLNAWGTAAKILDGALCPQSEALAASAEALASYQTHFVESIRDAKRHGVEVQTLGEFALAASADLEPLARFACHAFQRLCVVKNAFRFWPLRGGLSGGAQFGAEPSSGPTVGGRGSVEAAYLEKSGQKGARLFVSSAVHDALRDAGWRVRENRTRGRPHGEICWLKPDGGEAFDLFLSKELNGSLIHEHLSRARSQLLSEPDNYRLQMAASIADLLEWAHAPRACLRNRNPVEKDFR